MTVSTTAGGDFKGVSFAASTEGTAYNQLNLSSLHLPLTDTVVPARGSSTPTFTRATAAWSFDNEGKLNLNVPSGCVRFSGGRLVRNLVVASENFASTEWATSGCTKPATNLADPFGGTTACRVSSNGTSQQYYIIGTATTLVNYTINHIYTISFYVKAETITKVQLTGPSARFGSGQYANLDLSSGSIISTTGCTAKIEPYNQFYRVQISITCTSSGTGISGVCVPLITGLEGRLPTTTASGTFVIAKAQTENVTGQSSQTASEYVSVGVLSSPYHGAGTAAGADGCKWFPTNKDGSAIPSSTLEGYLAEPSRTNNCLWGRDATNAVWVKTNVTAAKTTTGLDNVANSASRLTAAATDATITQLLTAATGSRTASVWIKRISGTGTISITRNGGTAWTDVTSQLVVGTWVPVALTSDVGANPTVGLKMGTSGDVIAVDCFQDENGAWRTNPILTTTSAVTRNADALSYASAFDVTQGTALCSVKSAVPINSGSQATLLDSVGCVMLYLSSGLARTSIGSYDGANTASASGAGDITTGIRKRAVRWGADLKTSGDGLLGTAATFDGGMGSTGNLEVGSENSASQLSGTLREVHIWPTPLTDAQMQQVTS